MVALTLALCSCSGSSAPTGPNSPSVPGTFVTAPSDAELSVSDVANFWAAYDAGASSANFQTLYLDRASAGLNDFIRVRSVTAASLAAMVSSAPRYFAAARAGSGQITSVSAQIRANYATMKSLYPATVFPTVTFLVGRFSTAGTVNNNRLLVGTEFYGGGPTVPVDELSPFARSNVHPVADITGVVAHEHTHFLQSRAGARLGSGPLIEQAFYEGSADFVGEMVSGTNINAAIHAWALPREHAIWLDFKSAMSGSDVSRWLYNQGTATADWPGDLGYFVGYRIAKAYYDRATDKTAALREILETRDPAALLVASGYNP